MASDKLISANYLLDKVQYRIDTPGIIGSTVRDMVATTRRIIEEAPTVDAVEVVRCRDCKHSELEETECGAKYIYCCRTDDCVEADDFCSYGERR